MSALRIKPHLSAHVLSAGETALLGETGRFALHGEIFAALIPLLEGTLGADALAEKLASRFSPECVYHALMQLEAEGHIVEAKGQSGDRAADAWWSAHGIALDADAQTLHCNAVHVIDAGAYPPALACLQEKLEGFSMLRQGENRIALVVTGDYLDPQVHRAIQAALADFRWVLPARLAGFTVWLGPLLDGTTATRLTLLLRRLSENRPADLAALRQGAQFPLLPAQGLPQTHDLAASWIASALASITAGQPSTALIDSVLTLNPWTLETRRHSIVVHQSVARQDGDKARIELTACPKRYITDGGHRSVTPDQTLTRLEPLISPVTGIIPHIEKVSAPEAMHVYVATQVLSRPAVDLRANRLSGSSCHAAGKGSSDAQAKVSCLAEAVERYSCGYFGDEPRRNARAAELAERVLHPAHLLQFSDAQYRNRDDVNAAIVVTNFNWVPVRFDQEREIDWTPAWSLTFEERVWLPTAFCYFGYPVAGDHDFCQADSNGCAAGNTIEEAILQGALELVERDACALWWYNRLRRPGIDLDSFGDAFLDDIVAEFDRRGRDLVAIDLTTDVGITVVVAISWRRREGDRIFLGLGSHLEPRLAISRAISELNQAAVFDFIERQDTEHAEPRQSGYARWLREATIENQSYLCPTPRSFRRIDDFANHSRANIRDEVEWCIARLRTNGLEMVVLDQTRPDIGFPVARVVVPGLRHFWARLAPGRLYDVPVTLGWLKRPSAENELNPIPFFL